MPLKAGARLGPYEILAPLGGGGMGEVYRARDERLKREVAIESCRSRWRRTDKLEPLLKILYVLSPSWLKIDPNFDPLRKNPRFQKLVGSGR